MNNIQNLKIRDLILALEKLPQNATLSELEKKQEDKNPVKKMVDNIIAEFDFDRVLITMEALNWRWASSENGIPSMDELVVTSRQLLEKAAELRLGEYLDTHYEVGVISGTGGFKATAYCNEEKTEVDYLELEFIVSEWSVEG